MIGFTLSLETNGRMSGAVTGVNPAFAALGVSGIVILAWLLFEMAAAQNQGQFPDQPYDRSTFRGRFARQQSRQLAGCG